MTSRWRSSSAILERLLFYDGVATAVVDPTITLDGRLGPDLFTLNIGGAIVPGRGGTIPEPAAWALMFTDFGLVGGMARQKRTRVVAA